MSYPFCDETLHVHGGLDWSVQYTFVYMYLYSVHVKPWRPLKYDLLYMYSLHCTCSTVYMLMWIVWYNVMISDTCTCRHNFTHMSFKFPKEDWRASHFVMKLSMLTYIIQTHMTFFMKPCRPATCTLTCMIYMYHTMYMYMYMYKEKQFQLLEAVITWVQSLTTVKNNEYF